MTDRFFERPVLNAPYDYPARHWELDESGQPTSRIVDGRRRVSFVTPIPKPKRRGASQGEMVFDEAARRLAGEGQQYDLTEIIDSVRHAVDEWRALPDPAKWRVTPETARLLRHWRHHEFNGLRPFFCQVEAVETAIWLTEVAPALGNAGRRFLDHLAAANEAANPDLPRLALKLATGAGKTTVMAMLIAWQTVNAVRRPNSRRFTRGFLVVAPGLTIRDRLRVLRPNDPDSYYRSRELVPADMLGDLDRAKIVIANFHAFKPRETMAVSKGGRALLQGRGGGPEPRTLETEGQMLRRVMPELMGLGNVMALNDEAHHCYREKPGEDDEGALKGEDRKEAEKNREAARLWISGLEAVGRALGLARVVDLSATPFFLRGSGYAEGTLFPWTVSDFSLMDAIECGIVKLPRVPVADNIPGGDMPKFRNLWDHIGGRMPRKGRGKAGGLDPLKLPVELQTALEALYGHYEETFRLWREAGIEAPPCFIVVCNNTATSKLVYDYVSGFTRENPDGSTALENGRLALFRNFDAHGDPLGRPHTLLIDSEQLESGQALDGNFRALAADEIERFRREIVARTGDRRQAENLSDQDLLREAMNTVGKPGRLGGATRCVVSVSMLTEGWDANTVTHVLGVRAFGTQLLCEQVVGRALRRQSYDLNEDGLLDPEYADVLGVPFDFTAEPVIVPPRTPRDVVWVTAVTPERDAREIRFPRVAGYRVELPEERLEAAFDDDSTLVLTPDLVGPSVTPQRRHRGRGRDLEPRASPGHAPLDPAVPPDEAPPGNEVARSGRGAEAAPFRPAQRDRPPMARWPPRLQGRHPAGPAHVSGARRHGLRAHHAGDRRASRGRAADRRRPRRLQPGRLDRPRPLRHLEEDPLADRSATLPRQLGGLRQRLGGRVLPRRRGASARARLRQEPGSGAGNPLPDGLRIPDLRPRFHRAGGRRARRGRPAASHRRDQGLARRGREGQEGDDGDLLGARREPARRIRPLGLRRVHGRPRNRKGLARPDRSAIRRSAGAVPMTVATPTRRGTERQ